MAKEAKTNAMRILERAKVAYTAHVYTHQEGVALDGVTVFDESALAQEKIYVSGGRIGTQVCCAPAELIRAAGATTAHIIF